MLIIESPQKETTTIKELLTQDAYATFALSGTIIIDSLRQRKVAYHSNFRLNLKKN